MSSPVQGEDIPQHAATVAQHAPASSDAAAARPGWPLLCLVACCLAGALSLILWYLWNSKSLSVTDVQEYHHYALAFWTQPPLFHQFPKEYPPLALLPFSLTLFPAGAIDFYWVFALWMGLLACCSYIWLARAVSHQKALAYATYLVTGTAATVLLRFDLIPALATLGALLLAERRRFTWAYLLLAIGALLKLYPVFLLLVLAVYHWRISAASPAAQPGQDETSWRERLRPPLQGIATFAGVVLLGFGIPALLNWEGAFAGFGYNLTRPTQIESLPATLLWLGTFLGFPVQAGVSFGSVNLTGPLEDLLKQLSLVGLIGGTLLVCWRVWRGKLSLGQAFLAALAVVLAANKILSAQYLIWILPLVAYIEGFDVLWLVICLLTTLVYPSLYHFFDYNPLLPTDPIFLGAIALRNVFLLVAAARAIWRRPSRQRPRPAAAEASASLAMTGAPSRGRSTVARTRYKGWLSAQTQHHRQRI